MTRVELYLFVLGPAAGLILAVVAFSLARSAQQARNAAPEADRREFTHWLEQAWYETPPGWIAAFVFMGGLVLGVIGLQITQESRAEDAATAIAGSADAVRRANMDALVAAAAVNREAAQLRNRRRELEARLDHLAHQLKERYLSDARETVAWLLDYRDRSFQAAEGARTAGAQDLAGAYEREARQVQALTREADEWIRLLAPGRTKD